MYLTTAKSKQCYSSLLSDQTHSIFPLLEYSSISHTVSRPRFISLLPSLYVLLCHILLYYVHLHFCPSPTPPRCFGYVLYRAINFRHLAVIFCPYKFTFFCSPMFNYIMALNFTFVLLYWLYIHFIFIPFVSFHN